MKSKKIIFLVGPTAVGKTPIGAYLARKIHGEIVSCDSMQIYRGISIASNKPTQEELAQAPHHLLDIVSLGDEFDVAMYFKLAQKAIDEIHQRAKVPLVVGGSGMYMQVLLDGIFEGGPKDLSLRKELESRIKEQGTQALYTELEKVDPHCAAKIHPNDSRRIIRALEVYRTEKEQLSKLKKKREGFWGKYDISIFGLNRKREDLYRRINARVDQMFAQGIVEEVKAISQMDLSLSAQQLIGVKELLKAFKGEYDLERAKYLIKLNTRHYAKRQLTWFNRESRIEWIMVKEQDTAENIGTLIFKKLSGE